MLQKFHDLTFLYFETKSEGNFFHLKRLNKCERKQVKAHFQLSMFSNPLLRTSTNHVVTEAVVVCKHGESPLGPIGGDAEMNL